MIFTIAWCWVVIGALVALGAYSCMDDLNIPQIIDIGIFWPFAIICVIIIGIKQWIRRLT